jgi:putative hydrolase of the HAD superfamily
MITTVVFDLDDTLYDEIEYCRSGFASVAEFLVNRASSIEHRASAEGIFAALWKQFSAGNHKRTFNSALDELGIRYNDGLIQELIKVYRDHVPKITLPADSRDVLVELRDKYTLALLTDGFLPAQQLKVRALGIEEYFKCIIYTEQLGRDCWKPSPIGFEKLLQTLNTKAETVAYIADNEEKDFIGPNKLGILTIQIIRPARVHTESAPQPGFLAKTRRGEASAQYIIHEIGQLPALLVKI